LNYETVYIQAQIISIILLLALGIISGKNKAEKDVSYGLYVYAIAIALFDIARVITIGREQFFLSHICSIIYYILPCFAMFVWAGFCLRQIMAKNTLPKAYPAVWGVIIAVILGTSILWQSEIYKVALPSVNIICILAVIILASVKRDNQSENIELALTGLPIVIAHIAQWIIPYGLSSVSFALFFTLFVLYEKSQHKQTVTDNLTKLQNRYGMDEEICEQLEQFRRDKNDSFYIIACDLDDFKTINDTWGHAEGDRALKLIADVLKKVAEEHGSIPFRIGGDEFVIITDKSSEGLADEVCRAVEKEVENINFRDDFTIKISMGVSLYDGKTDVSNIINRADTKLYEEKRKRKSK